MEITEHQANMLRAVLDGKKLEVVEKKTAHGSRFEIKTLDNFMLFISSPDWYEVRIKPDVIVVNGIEVPAPEKEAPAIGERYYVASPTHDDAYRWATWCDDEQDRRYLRLDVLHKSRDAAAAHGKAMLAHKPG